MSILWKFLALAIALGGRKAPSRRAIAHIALQCHPVRFATAVDVT